MDKMHQLEIMDRYLQGITTEEEDKILKDWIQQPDSKEDFYDYYKKCWYLASDEMDKNIQNEMLSNILGEINKTDQTDSQNETKPSIHFPFLRYAISACIIFAVGISAYFLGKNQINSEQGVVTLSVKNGQKADILLADGTHVFMNSDSKITYDNSYNKKDRVLSLTGEAYFEVAKDKKRPFIVKTSCINVEALGTSFNVNAYPNNKSISVILLEGKVKVDDTNKEEILKPNERLEYNLTSKEFKKGEVNANSNPLLWRSKELTFYGESLEEICNSLTHMYNCNFTFKTESVKRFTFNGTIKNNSLDNVLDFISQTASIKYEKTSNNTIVFFQ